MGAHSLAFHGRPRYTGDLDILVSPDAANAVKLVAMLIEFGFGEAGFKESDFTQEAQVIQLGRAPNRIDLLTSLTGVTNAEAFADKVEACTDGLPVYIVSKHNLIRNKPAAGRPQHLADLAELER
ncbi:MAG TPA: hypothetical protein VLO30_05645 [Chthoniobacterales bacterium]|nr:hypothetical protein [Chthoniobacterales bacterium]